MNTEARENAARELHEQADRMPSSLFETGELLRLIADRHIAVGGVMGEILQPHLGAGFAVLPGRRLESALHYLALGGEAPGTEDFYPCLNGGRDTEPGAAERLWPKFERLLNQKSEEISKLLEQPIQTNSPGRSDIFSWALSRGDDAPALVGPVRLLEIGASAGLAALWRSDILNEGGPRIEQRRGCDLNPIDLSQPDGRRWLKAWQAGTVAGLEKLSILDDTDWLEHMAEQAPIDQEDARTWLGKRLAEPWEGTTVVCHSFVQMYVNSEAWADIENALNERGAMATDRNPIRLIGLNSFPEPGGKARTQLRISDWVGDGVERREVFDIASGSDANPRVDPATRVVTEVPTAIPARPAAHTMPVGGQSQLRRTKPRRP
ncbi:MAG: DUF2332 family protein [Corynebacteriales bacterium]|nr:DUF2332 family protein [Mycobacteriales bacterium]